MFNGIAQTGAEYVQKLVDLARISPDRDLRFAAALRYRTPRNLYLDYVLDIFDRPGILTEC